MPLSRSEYSFKLLSPPTCPDEAEQGGRQRGEPASGKNGCQSREPVLAALRDIDD